MNFFDIVTGAPVWVWVVFVYLLIIGLKAIRPHTIPVWRLLIFPGIIGIWSLIGFTQIVAGLSKFEIPVLQIRLILVLAYAASFIVGYLMGWYIHRNISIKADWNRYILYMPGSGELLVMVLMIFSVKFYFGFLCATATSKETVCIYQLGSILFSVFVTGMWIGRAKVLISHARDISE